MLAFWKPRGLTGWRAGVRPGTSESRNREVAPQNRAPGKSRGRSKWGGRNLTAPRAPGELSSNPAPPSAKREPCGRRRLGPRLPRLDGKRQHTLPSRSSPRIPPGPFPDPPRSPAAPGRPQLRAARTLPDVSSPRQVVLLAEAADLPPTQAMISSCGRALPFSELPGASGRSGSY